MLSKLRVSLVKAADQFSQVLHCGDEQVLDCLLPESAPTGPLKTMTISGIGKATFDQVLASFEVIFSRFRVGDLPSSIQ